MVTERGSGDGAVRATDISPSVLALLRSEAPGPTCPTS